MTLTARIRHLLANGASRKQMIEAAVAAGYVGASVDSILFKIRDPERRRAHDLAYQEKRRRKRGARPLAAVRADEAKRNKVRDRLIRKHYGRDLSASQIAARLGTTRNAVIGRANRIGVSAE